MKYELVHKYIANDAVLANWNKGEILLMTSKEDIVLMKWIELVSPLEITAIHSYLNGVITGAHMYLKNVSFNNPLLSLDVVKVEKVRKKKRLVQVTTPGGSIIHLDTRYWRSSEDTKKQTKVSTSELKSYVEWFQKKLTETNSQLTELLK